MTSFETVYVADVGGTNARFALAQQKDDKLFNISNSMTYSCEKFQRFEDVFSQYSKDLTEKNIPLPNKACIAIAAIIQGDSVAMTSLPWAFSINKVKQQCQLSELYVINDFVGQAMAVPYLPTQDIRPIKTGTPIEDCPIVVLGPGTGLGSALIVPFQSDSTTKWIPVAAQGGHVNFTPINDTEHALCQYFLDKKGYVSFETFVCGSGISHIYEGLHVISNTPYSALAPAEIAQQALDQSNPIAQTTLEYFFSFLGRFAGNAALLCGATGGVYLAGGILPKLKTALDDSKFIDQFMFKGVSSGFVEEIPVYLIEHKEPALIGCAAYIANQ